MRFLNLKLTIFSNVFKSNLSDKKTPIKYEEFLITYLLLIIVCAWFIHILLRCYMHFTALKKAQKNIDNPNYVAYNVDFVA